MTDDVAFEINTESYPWQSEAQKEGYLNYVQFMRARGKPIQYVDETVAYFIQKDHESNEYWRDLVGDQVASLQRELHSLQRELRGLHERISSLFLAVDAHSKLLPHYGTREPLTTETE